MSPPPLSQADGAQGAPWRRALQFFSSIFLCPSIATTFLKILIKTTSFFFSAAGSRVVSFIEIRGIYCGPSPFKALREVYLKTEER